MSSVRDHAAHIRPAGALGPPVPCVSSAERVLSGGRAEPVDDAAGHVVTPERVETLEHVGVLHAGPEVGADQVERAGAHHARVGDINGPILLVNPKVPKIVPRLCHL